MMGFGSLSLGAQGPFWHHRYRLLNPCFSNVQIVNPHNKDIRDIPGLAPPVIRKLLWDPNYG